MAELKQMRLSTFAKMYDIPRSTAHELIHTKGFPAYKIYGRWYVDIEKYEKWREQKHRECYKYA